MKRKDNRIVKRSPELDCSIRVSIWHLRFGDFFWSVASEKRENVCNDEQDRLAHHFNHPRLRSVASFAYCLTRSYIPDDIVSLESMDRVFFFNLCLQCLSLIQQDVLEAVSFIADEDDLNHSICSDLADNFIVRGYVMRFTL